MDSALFPARPTTGLDQWDVFLYQWAHIHGKPTTALNGITFNRSWLTSQDDVHGDIRVRLVFSLSVMVTRLVRKPLEALFQGKAGLP